MAGITDEEALRLQNGLTAKSELIWDTLSPQDEDLAHRLAEDYKSFLNEARTERKAAHWLAQEAQRAGFAEPKKGTRKMIFLHRNKAVALGWVGRRPPEEGLRILGSHLDSPRLDFKINPLYEDGELVFLKSQYYGVIKKYHWLARPLGLCGVVAKADGRLIQIEIGFKADDPVFTIEDLAPHLMNKSHWGQKLSEAFEGEKLNLLMGSRPLGSSRIKERFKLNILKILHERYGLQESDFASAELSAVPAEGARDVGLDRSLIGGYGHDDRAGSYAAWRALLSVENPACSGLAIFVDKEEIESEGNTSAQSHMVSKMVGQLLACAGKNPSAWAVEEILSNSKALSTETIGAFHPDYAAVHEKRNAAKLGYGPALLKYSGIRMGKIGTNDTSAEYLGWLRQVFSKAGVLWQGAHVGKVDKGVCNTIAMFLARHDLDVVDICVPAFSMHSPMELVSKADLFMAVKAMTAFLMAE